MAAPLGTHLKSLLTGFTRLTLSAVESSRTVHTQGCPLLFNASAQLWGLPMKKKKRLDPAILIHREQRKKKKIERQLKRMMKFSRQLKPVDEIAGDVRLRRGAESRKRETTVLTFNKMENRALLHKDWTRYCMNRHVRELMAITAALKCQQRALDALREESEELYQLAIQTEEEILPVEFRGPVETPPIKDFDSIDGEYFDRTKDYLK